MSFAQILIWLGIAGISTVLLVKALVIVPTFHIGQVRRLQRLTGRTLGPGLNVIIPLLEDVLLQTAGGDEATFELQRIPIEVTVISSDDLGIDIKGSIQCRRDPELANTLFAIGKEAMSQGIADAVKSELGAIAGKKKGRAFRAQRDAIQLLINCVFRMETAPHREPRRYGDDSYAPGQIAPVEKRLEFYEQNVGAIKALLAGEKNRPTDRAKIEKRYGIDVETFELTHVGFSDKTMNALEQQQRAVAEMAAADEVRRRVIAIAKEFMAQGVSAEAAVDKALIIVGKMEGRHISLGGVGDISGLVKELLRKGR